LDCSADIGSIPVRGGRRSRKSAQHLDAVTVMAVWYRAVWGALSVAATSICRSLTRASVRPDESRTRTVMDLCRREAARLASSGVKALILLIYLGAPATVNAGLTLLRLLI